MGTHRVGKTVGLLWLTVFLGYWAWHFAGAVGVALLVIAWVVLGLAVRHK